MTPEPTVLLLGSPFPHYSRETFLKKLSRVLSEICDSVQVLGANEPHEADSVSWKKMSVPDDANQLIRYLSLLNCQVQSLRYARSTEFDFCIIRITPYLIPAFGLQFSRAPSGTIVTQRTYNPINNFISSLTLHASECLIVESEAVLDEWPGNHHKKSVVGATYVDQTTYERRKPFVDRNEVIGYLGVLNERKGIPSLTRSIPAVLQNEPGVRFRIGGDGPLSDIVTRTASQHEAVEYLGYVPDEELTEFYNSLKLFVLPTDSEGLPNVALESMACGTPVLATSVGGLPDLITDGENGFLMEGNSSSDIKSNISRALNSNLETVSERARESIQCEYTFDDAVQRYEQIVNR